MSFNFTSFAAFRRLSTAILVAAHGLLSRFRPDHRYQRYLSHGRNDFKNSYGHQSGHSGIRVYPPGRKPGLGPLRPAAGNGQNHCFQSGQ